MAAAGPVLAAATAVLLAACGASSPAAQLAPPAVSAPSATSPSGPSSAASVAGRPPASGSDGVLATSPPTRVRIGAIGVDVPIVPVGVDGTGEMAIPEDIQTVGWYRFGPAPGGSAGSAVLAGHIDDRIQGRGAFFDLREVGDGDSVRVDLADGSERDYRVDRVQEIDKSVLPVDQLFTRDGPPVLTLVTCGGDFDRASRNYLQNVVVTAEPVQPVR